MMTGTEKRELVRALELAAEKAHRITGRGTRKADGARVWTVTSYTEADRWHVVVEAGVRLECDCYRSRSGRVCSHRATVYADKRGMTPAEALAALTAPAPAATEATETLPAFAGVAVTVATVAEALPAALATTARSGHGPLSFIFK